MLVKLSGSRSDFTGKLAGLNWVDGKTNVPPLSQRLIRGYGVVEYNPTAEVTFNINVTNPEGFEEILKDKRDELTEIIKNAGTKPEAVFEDKPQSESEEAQSESTDEPGEKSQVLKDFEELHSEPDTEGAKALADIVAAKKQEVVEKAAVQVDSTEAPAAKDPAPTMKKSEVKSLTDFKGKGSWGKYKKYVIELTGTSPKNKEQCVEALDAFKATLSD